MRAAGEYATKFKIDKFPFLFGGTFIEGLNCVRVRAQGEPFPFLFGGTFIEGMYRTYWGRYIFISLPFRRDFH